MWLWARGMCTKATSSCPVPLQHGAEDVKNHKWFKGISWDHVLQRGLMVSPTHHTQE